MALRRSIRLVLPLIAIILLVAAVRDRSPAADSVAAEILPALSTDTDDAASNRLVEGFQAFAAGQTDTAVRLLTEPSGYLEDWRLLILAESAQDVGDAGLADSALEELISEHEGSPIRGLAIQRAAAIAAEHELWDSAMGWVEFARGETLPLDKAREIETMAWEMGADLGLPELQSQAGRHLLIDHPMEADELEVEVFFQDEAGRVDWAHLLTRTELERRAQRQIENRKPEEAIATLELVTPEQRSFDWSLLHAEALTHDRRGREALEVLASLESSQPDRRVKVAWQRALAAREAARVRRGRTNLPQSRRDEMSALARASLGEVAQTSTDAELRLRALKVLFAMVSDEQDSFEPSLAVLRQLQGLDSDDTTGTRFLFRLGWQAYTKRDYPVAIGYWSELESMYSGTNSARSGRYWTGRSHEALGHADRAADIYAEILASQADDFYSRHARSRLEIDARPSLRTPELPTEPWPEDPALNRARWLRDLNLDEQALEELEGQRPNADPRALCAEKAVLLARLGQRRESIQSLVCAFPTLGRASQSLVPREALMLYYPLDFRSIIEQRAHEQGLSPQLVFAMVRQESAFDAEARSWAGARGLMQLMPATGKEVAQRLGLRYSTVRLDDPDFSVRLGTRYFRQVLDMFDGNQELALAGYNGGPYRIKKLWRQAGSDPELDRFVEGLTLEETKTYVKRILLFEDSYHRLYSEGS